MQRIPFVRNDGGAKVSGFPLFPGDCVTRAIAIATGLPYERVFLEIAKRNVSRSGRWTHPGTITKNRILSSLAIHFDLTKVSPDAGLTLNELPPGRYIVAFANHWLAVADRVIQDSWDSQGKRTRKIKDFYFPRRHEIVRYASMNGINAQTAYLQWRERMIASFDAHKPLQGRPVSESELLNQLEGIE